MKLLAAGLANNKTSLGEIFRRYIQCFKNVMHTDVFDLTDFVRNKNMFVPHFSQYTGAMDHNFKYFHTTFDMYAQMHARKKTTIKSTAKKIGYFVWETTELSKKHQEVLHQFDEIWTASSFCKQVFDQYISSSTTKIVNHPIEFFDNNPKKFNEFTILFVANLSSDLQRKNVADTLSVLNDFAEKYDVDIIFKTTTMSVSEMHSLKSLANKKIKILDNYLTSFEISQLISKCHILFSLHRSEGFGLTLAEAMACKTLAIGTGFSGNTDFMTSENSFLIEYDLEKIKNHAYFTCGQWAHPSVNDALDKLDYAYNAYNSTAIQSKIENAYKLINTNYSFVAVTNQIKSLL